MQKVFLKLFLFIFLMETTKSEMNFCENKKMNCNINETNISTAESGDLINMLKISIQNFNEMSVKFENNMKTMARDINSIQDSLKSAKCLAKNESKTVTAFNLYSNLWLIIQRRQDGSTDFYRNWYNYKQGFGHPFREFFLGLDKIHYLTNSARHELLIRVEDFKGRIKYALYDEFVVGNETEKYQLKKLGSYSGNSGDYLRYHEGMYFSTKNVDNDASDDVHCAKRYQGGWWYNDCMTSNLNGPFRTRYAQNSINMTWGDRADTQNRIVQMMLRLRP